MTKKNDNPKEKETPKKEKPKPKTTILELKSSKEELENIIQEIQETNPSQPTKTKIIDPSLKISNIIPQNTLEQGLRDIPTESEDDNQDLAQYGIQDDYATAGGDYDPIGNSDDDSQSYDTGPSLAMDNNPQNAMQSGTGYPGTKRKKNKSYNTFIGQSSDEEKKKKEKEKRMW